jgi:ZIP family zinc transporter
MSAINTIILLTLFAGLAMPFGALLASINLFKLEWLDTEFKHVVIAFGGGALLSAVALVLVPEGVEHLTIGMSVFYFILGGLFFMVIDIAFSKIKTSASQLMAMMADFVPESLALGATFLVKPQSALLLAALIALQNIPEGFNAFDELRASSNFSRLKIVLLFTLLALLGPISGVLGYIFLADSPTIISSIMLFASGSILYSVFQDIAPQVPLEKHWFPPMGAVIGFVFGLIGYMLTQT